MSLQFVLVFGAVIACYSVASYYAGTAVLRLVGELIAARYLALFWSFWLVLSLLPFAVTFAKNYFLTHNLAYLMLPGYYWLFAVYYFSLLMLLALGIAWLIRNLGGGFFQDLRQITLVVLILTALFSLYGAYNARNPIIQNYQITIAKNSPGISSLRAVMVADLHLGFIIDEKRLAGLVAQINALQPDIVFFAGDMIEDGADFFQARRMGDELRKLKPPLGVYAVLGNHEYISEPVEKNIQCLEKAGIILLRDEYIQVAHSFYVIGRDDISLTRFTGKKRLELNEVMQGIDRSLPLILLDHQPFHLTEAQAAQVDLSFSGHTHSGQFFPNNLITRAIYLNDWGYLKIGGLHTVVTSGFGTWGPPIRIGNFPEIIALEINFTK